MCYPDESEQHNKNMNKLSSASSPPMSQRVRHRLFKQPQSPGTIKSATNRLLNFVKSGTQLTDSKIPSKVHQTPILFNKEDDEIYNDRDNLKFWQHLKSVKLPTLTNTITLGRKFKSNVLKMNIFSTFSVQNNGVHDDSLSTARSPETTGTQLRTDNKTEKNQASQALKDLFTNEIAKKSYSRNKLLRNTKHKKLIQKTIDSMSKESTNFTNISNINNNNNNKNSNESNHSARLLSYTKQSNLYKTL